MAKVYMAKMEQEPSVTARRAALLERSLPDDPGRAE